MAAAGLAEDKQPPPQRSGILPVKLSLPDEPDERPEPQAALPDTLPIKLSLTGGLDCASAYYFRGYLQADRGLILQPYLNFFAACPCADGAVIRPYVSLFHSAHFGDDNPMKEMSDAMAGAVTTWRGLTVDARYAFYNTAPTMRSAVHELGVRGSWDIFSPWKDSSAAGWFSLRPFAGLYGELSDQRGVEGVYVETGLEPSWRFAVGGMKGGIGLPLVWGLSADDYYFNEAGGNAPLGYFGASVTASISLPAPARCGQWFLNGSFQYLRLVADNLVDINRGDRDAFIAKAGVGFLF